MELPLLLTDTALSSWIQLPYCTLDRVEQLRIRFSKQQPFPHLELPDFFHLEKAVEIIKALAEEPFELKEADLFKFKQTADLRSTQNHLLKSFREFLASSEFASYLSYITSITLKPHHLDVSGTLYEDTDYLLCHDDRLDTRKIAYFYYLSSLEKNDGGGLNLFGCKKGVPLTIRKTITPAFNTFAFFLVSEQSFHEVAEVVRDIQRLALSGWFHDQ